MNRIRIRRPDKFLQTPLHPFVCASSANGNPVHQLIFQILFKHFVPAFDRSPGFNGIFHVLGIEFIKGRVHSHHLDSIVGLHTGHVFTEALLPFNGFGLKLTKIVGQPRQILTVFFSRTFKSTNRLSRFVFGQKTETIISPPSDPRIYKTDGGRFLWRPSG